MHALTEGDLHFYGYVVSLDVDFEGKRLSFAGMANWNDSAGTVPAFVLELAFDGATCGADLGKVAVFDRPYHLRRIQP
jgi:hypothetical protein